jgi:hypothetical protein
VPDVLGFADFAARPDLTFGLVGRRMDDELLFSDAKDFPLPKASGRLRQLKVLNPLDELVLRTYVGRVSESVVTVTHSSNVLNGIISNPGPGWYSADFRTQSARRRQLQRSYYNDPSTAAVGFFDVRDFYKSCDHRVLADLLTAARAPSGAVALLTLLLDRLFPSRVGLPVGFEGSGPLANLYLGGVDRYLDLRGLHFVRWTDDIDVFLNDSASWPGVRSDVEDRLADVGLALNVLKTTMQMKGDAAAHRLLDPGRDSMFLGDVDDNVKAKLLVDEWMQDWGAQDGSDLPPAHMRSIFGYLRGKADPAGATYLKRTPEWIYRESATVGSYLAAVLSDPRSRIEVDLDWLVDAATAAPEAPKVAGQLHLMRSLCALPLEKGHGTRARDFALQPEVALKYPALGAWSTMAWSRSRAWTMNDGIEFVDAVGRADYRRAALAGFAPLTPKPLIANRLALMAVRDPALGPVVHGVALA